MTQVAAGSSSETRLAGGVARLFRGLLAGSAPGLPGPDAERRRRAHDVSWTRLLLLAIFLGLFCVAVNGIGSRTAFAVGLLLAAACLAVGGLAGFLFGVPRSLQGAYAVDAAEASNRRNGEDGAARYATNTNLEQISDWLTKILVGVGLTQIGPIVGWLKAAGNHFGPALGPEGAALALCIIVYFGISGFFYTYLWTRLILIGVMTRADQDASERLRRFVEQDQLDLRALTVIERHLAGKPPAEGAPELADAIAAASPRAKKLIFYEAEEVRTRCWRQHKGVVARTIPIFRALIQGDPQGLFYKTRAKLAYALKDQRDPSPADLAEATSLLDEAIEKRDLRSETAPLFEFNRAICRIMLDDNFKKALPAAAQQREAIVADLQAAAPALRRKFREEPVASWLALNCPDSAPGAALPAAAQIVEIAAALKVG